MMGQNLVPLYFTSKQLSLISIHQIHEMFVQNKYITSALVPTNLRFSDSGARISPGAPGPGGASRVSEASFKKIRRKTQCPVDMSKWYWFNWTLKDSTTSKDLIWAWKWPGYTILHPCLTKFGGKTMINHEMVYVVPPIFRHTRRWEQENTIQHAPNSTRKPSGCKALGLKHVYSYWKIPCQPKWVGWCKRKMNG